MTTASITKDHDVLRAQIESNLQHASAQRMHEQFLEMNPHLARDKRFEERWTQKRKDAAVLVPIIKRPQGATVLLTVRSPDMPSHAGQISFPGGKVQPEDLSREDTALREAHEEVNIEAQFVDVIGQLGAHVGGLGFQVTPIVGLVDPAADLRACPREVDEIFETPLDFVLDLNNHKIHEREDNGVVWKSLAIPYGEYHIWGLTAGILNSLAVALNEAQR